MVLEGGIKSVIEAVSKKLSNVSESIMLRVGGSALLLLIKWAVMFLTGCDEVGLV